MTTMTFLRKFFIRMVVGATVLALPNVVFAVQTGSGDGGVTPPVRHHTDHQNSSGGSESEDGTTTTINFSVSPETLSQVSSILTQLSASGCTQASGASSALNSLLGA